MPQFVVREGDTDNTLLAKTAVTSCLSVPGKKYTPLIHTGFLYPSDYQARPDINSNLTKSYTARGGTESGNLARQDLASSSRRTTKAKQVKATSGSATIYWHIVKKNFSFTLPVAVVEWTKAGRQWYR